MHVYLYYYNIGTLTLKKTNWWISVHFILVGYWYSILNKLQINTHFGTLLCMSYIKMGLAECLTPLLL